MSASAGANKQMTSSARRCQMSKAVWSWTGKWGLFMEPHLNAFLDTCQWVIRWRTLNSLETLTHTCAVSTCNTSHRVQTESSTLLFVKNLMWRCTLAGSECLFPFLVYDLSRHCTFEEGRQVWAETLMWIRTHLDLSSFPCRQSAFMNAWNTV